MTLLTSVPGTLPPLIPRGCTQAGSPAAIACSSLHQLACECRAGLLAGCNKPPSTFSRRLRDHDVDVKAATLGLRAGDDMARMTDVGGVGAARGGALVPPILRAYDLEHSRSQ